jgi:hypothetical protein
MFWWYAVSSPNRQQVLLRAVYVRQRSPDLRANGPDRVRAKNVSLFVCLSQSHLIQASHSVVTWLELGLKHSGQFIKVPRFSRNSSWRILGGNKGPPTNISEKAVFSWFYFNFKSSPSRLSCSHRDRWHLPERLDGLSFYLSGCYVSH